MAGQGYAYTVHVVTSNSVDLLTEMLAIVARILFTTQPATIARKSFLMYSDKFEWLSSSTSMTKFGNVLDNTAISQLAS